MMFKTNSSFIAILIMSVLLTACGFHLRGLADIPFKTIYVEGNKNPISQDVIRALKNNGVEVTKEAEKAEVAIEIMNDTTVKRILSLGGGVGVVFWLSCGNILLGFILTLIALTSRQVG